MLNMTQPTNAIINVWYKIPLKSLSSFGVSAAMSLELTCRGGNRAPNTELEERKGGYRTVEMVVSQSGRGGDGHVAWLHVEKKKGHPIVFSVKADYGRPELFPNYLPGWGLKNKLKISITSDE